MKYTETVSVQMIVSDPWDWGTEIGVGPFDATILRWRIGEDGRPTGILLRLAEAVVFRGVECRYFVGVRDSPRENLEEIIRGNPVECALTHISEERARSLDPFDLSWWRGGIGLTCTVRAKQT